MNLETPEQITRLNLSIKLQSDVINAITKVLRSPDVIGKSNQEIVLILAQEAVHQFMISEFVKHEYKEWYVLGNLLHDNKS